MSETPKPISGSIDWNELITGDQNAACEFYAAVFGWTYEDWPMGDGQVYKLASIGKKKVAGIMARPPSMPAEAPPFWGAYITVDDCDATAAKAQELGASVLMPPMDIPKVGRMCTIQDPQGAVISFIKYAPCEEGEGCC